LPISDANNCGKQPQTSLSSPTVPIRRHHSLRAASTRSYECSCPSRDATTYIATS
jgi:hypothetical protein